MGLEIDGFVNESCEIGKKCGSSIYHKSSVQVQIQNGKDSHENTTVTPRATSTHLHALFAFLSRSVGEKPVRIME
jgi:hypothetical protein